MVPLFGHQLYRQFRIANGWVEEQLPNAKGTFYDEAEVTVDGIWWIGKLLLETMLAGPIGDRLEQWEYRRKIRRFASAMRKPNSSAQLDETQVKGHFDDHGHPTLQKYFQRLRECGLEQQTLTVPGD
jgi:hypothetical protein